MADRSLADRLTAMQSSADTEEEFDEILISRHSPPAENRIVKLPLDCLVDYADEHFEEITGRPQPFRLYDEESLQSLADSIRENGVMQPIIVRPLPDGSYQVIAGRNRRRASALCRLTTIPAIIKKDLDDVGAAMFMLDTNLEQRKGLCYSEKAYAYRMRIELQGRRGQRTDITGADKIDTLREVGKQNNDSRRTVAYLIRLTHLIPSLLRMVDDGTLGFKAAVSVSYLSKPTQELLLAVISAEGIKPKLGQIAKLRSLDDCGSVTPDVMKNLLCAKPKAAARKVTLEIPAESVYAEFADDTKEVQRLFLEFLKAYRKRAPCATDAQSPPQQVQV